MTKEEQSVAGAVKKSYRSHAAPFPNGKLAPIYGVVHERHAFASTLSFSATDLHLLPIHGRRV